LARAKRRGSSVAGRGGVSLSLCLLCVLCVSVVMFAEIHHKDTENTNGARVKDSPNSPTQLRIEFDPVSYPNLNVPPGPIEPLEPRTLTCRIQSQQLQISFIFTTSSSASRAPGWPKTCGAGCRQNPNAFCRSIFTTSSARNS